MKIHIDLKEMRDELACGIKRETAKLRVLEQIDKHLSDDLKVPLRSRMNYLANHIWGASKELEFIEYLYDVAGDEIRAWAKACDKKPTWNGLVEEFHDEHYENFLGEF